MSVVSPIASFQSNRARVSVVSRPLERPRRARSGQVHPKPAGRADPVPGEQDGDAELLQAWNRIAEHESDVVVVELDRGRLHRVEREAALGEYGLDQPELAVHRGPRVGRAEEAEHRVPTVVQERRGEGERRIVGRLQPQLEHDRGRPIGFRVGVLVET